MFFVTFRLKHSLPYNIIAELREEREHARLALQKLLESKRAQQNKLDDQCYFERWEEYLDKAESGPRWLSQPETAEVMKEALHF